MIIEKETSSNVESLREMDNCIVSNGARSKIIQYFDMEIHTHCNSNTSQYTIDPRFFQNEFPSTSILSHTLKRFEPILIERTITERKAQGKWTRFEQKAYIQYLQENKEEMSSKLSRKSKKVFLKMSQLVKSRTADQCRSHHQKILKYHNNLNEIIRYYTQEVFPFDPEVTDLCSEKKDMMTGEELLKNKHDIILTSYRRTNTFSFVVDALQVSALTYH